MRTDGGPYDYPRGIMSRGAWSAPRLTPAQWDEIRLRRDAGEKASALAREYGVRAALIYDRLGPRS